MATQARYLMVSAVCGGLAVVIGAFGAHGLESLLSGEMAEVFATGVKYHFYHALAMFALAAGSPALWASSWCVWACRAWLFGIAIFSGTLYVLALTEIRWLGAITPIGGVALILGWVFAALAARSLARAN